jgi:hypothetical protein
MLSWGMTNLQAYWIKPTCRKARFIRDLNKPWDKHNGGYLYPFLFGKKYPGCCLFSSFKTSPKSGWVQVFFHNPNIKQEYDMQEYWVDPNILTKKFLR